MSDVRSHTMSVRLTEEEYLRLLSYAKQQQTTAAVAARELMLKAM